MAKDIFQAKKRVSHFQKTHKELDGENELFGCKDFVSSIIQDMDSNFSCTQSGYFKRDIECNETNFTAPEDSLLSIPILQMPIPSFSQSNSQIPGKYSKTKKLLFSRKYPLMEKSQKILKQLKHNQNIPKPRAHLARIPKSPAKSKTKSIYSKTSVAKNKEMKVGNKIKINPLLKAPSNHSTIVNIKNSNISKIFKDGIAATNRVSKKVEDNTSGIGSLVDIPTDIDANTETNLLLESDSGTSDSEYERFLKKSKKNLPKNSSGIQKQKSRKNKSCTKSLKRKNFSHVSEQKNAYDCNNVRQTSKNSKISPCKKPKILEEITDAKNDLNCSDHYDILDTSTRDSSSESDDDSVATSMTQQLISKTCKIKHVGETSILSRANSSPSFPNLSVSELNNSDTVCSDNETQIVNSALGVKAIGETEIFSDTNLHQSCQSLHVLKSNINSDQGQSELLNETLVNSVKIELDSLPPNLIIDIYDSDDECNNGENNASELNSENVLSTSIENKTTRMADPESEDSDIEIVEVKKLVQTVDKCSDSILVEGPDCLNNVVSGKKQLVTENVCVDVKPSIKTENLDSKSSVNILTVVKSENAEIDNKLDVVYRTDICRTKILEQKAIDKNQNVLSNGLLQANSDIAVVKQESDSDDDIIILDSVDSTKVVGASSLSAKIEKIKQEPTTSESIVKLFDSVDSNPRIDDTNEWEKKIQGVIPVSSRELFEWYKMEFATYKEMKLANADVEATLKNIQARQLQKIQYVRNLFHKCVKSSEDTKPLMIQQGEDTRDSKNFFSVNVQNDCDITPNNSFSLSPQTVVLPTVELDIKPGVKQLMEEMKPVANKSEVESNQDNFGNILLGIKTESDDKQTLNVLNKKCSVCGKDAVAACQRCAKEFFCSHECGRKSWIDGHAKVCGAK